MSPDELSPILALDRGEFLEGFTLPDTPGFDTWAVIRREACQRQLETVYGRLSQQQLAMHDSAAAIETFWARCTLMEPRRRLTVSSMCSPALISLAFALCCRPHCVG
jgi:hypothetical protein